MKLFLFILVISAVSFSVNYISNCTNINYPGDYVLSNDVYFARPFHSYSNPTDACLQILSDNVHLNCDRHSIVGTNENHTRGIYFNHVQNISIENCEISSFDLSIGLDNSFNISLLGNYLFSDVYLEDSRYYSSSQVSIINNVFTTSSLSGWESYHNLTIVNNTFIDGGFYVALASDSSVSNNVVFNNTYVCSHIFSLTKEVPVSNNSFYSDCRLHLQGEGLIFANNFISSTSTYNGLDISRLKNSQIVNNIVCSPSLNRSTSYANKYFDIYGAWEGNKNIYLNNTCDTSNPQHICTKSCSGSDNLSRSNCPLSFLLLSIIFLFVLRGKIQ